MFGFKPTAAETIRKDQAVLKRDLTRYSRELAKSEQELNVLKKSLDIHVKRGNTTLAREVASKIVRVENNQASIKKTINDLQTVEDQIKGLQSLTSKANTQQSVNRLRATVLRTIDTKEVYKIQYDAEKQKDQIEMTEDMLQELFEEDDSVVEKSNNRVEELLAVSLEKSLLEDTMPSTSSYIPSALPAVTVPAVENLTSPILSSTPPPDQSTNLPTPLPKQDTSMITPSSSSPSLPSSSNSVDLSNLQERFNNLSK